MSSEVNSAVDHDETAEPDRILIGKKTDPIRLTDEEIEIYDGFRAAQRMVHRTATNAGWYRDPETGEPVQRNIGEVIALMHSELSEALEACRKSLWDDKLTHRWGIEVELADCVIRILDTAEALSLDIGGALIEKNRYNQSREDHKLSERAKNNGKKF